LAQAIALASIDCGAGTGDSCQQDPDGTGFRLKTAVSAETAARVWIAAREREERCKRHEKPGSKPRHHGRRPIPSVGITGVMQSPTYASTGRSVGT